MTNYSRKKFIALCLVTHNTFVTDDDGRTTTDDNRNINSAVT